MVSNRPPNELTRQNLYLESAVLEVAEAEGCLVIISMLWNPSGDSVVAGAAPHSGNLLGRGFERLAQRFARPIDLSGDIVVPMLIIRSAQMAVFRERRMKQFEATKLSDLASRYPSWYAQAGEAQALHTIRTGIGKARGYGITEVSDVSTFIDLMVRFGAAFDTLDSMAWETEALRDAEVDDGSRLELLLERLGLTSEFNRYEAGDVS
jgi:hypothetical protein